MDQTEGGLGGAGGKPRNRTGDENPAPAKRGALERTGEERGQAGGSSLALPLLETLACCQDPNPPDLCIRTAYSGRQIAERVEWVGGGAAEGRAQLSPLPAPPAPMYPVGGRISAEISSADPPLKCIVLPLYKPRVPERLGA